MKRILYCNADVLTMDDSHPHAEAVLVEDGKIIQVGMNDDFRDTDAECRDLQGKALLPAFIDPHSHFSGYASAQLQVPLDECVSFDEIQQKISDFIRDHHVPAGKWVICKGYDQNNLKEKKHPDRWVLDRVSPDNPVLCQHQSGHVCVLNSKGLEAMQITFDTPSPQGGLIGKNDTDVTGYFEEKASMNVVSNTPMPDMNELFKAILTAQEKYMSYGIATVQEGMMVDQMAPLYQALMENHLLKVDAVGYPTAQCYDQYKKLFPDSVRKYDRHFRIGGIKMILDGSPQAGTAWMRTPYAGTPDYYGYPSLTDQEVHDSLIKAAEEDTQILGHCNGDAAAAQYIRMVQKTAEENENIRHIKPVIIHAQLLDRDQLDAVKEYGMIPSFFIAHVYYYGDVHIKNFGMDRAEHISCAGSALKKGIRFTFHQDAPVISPNMLETVWIACTRRTKAGVELGPEEKISAYEALKAVTIHAACQYSEEDHKGSIECGKNADFVVLDRNPVKVDPMAIRNIKVLETIKDGETIYSKDN